MKTTKKPSAALQAEKASAGRGASRKKSAPTHNATHALEAALREARDGPTPRIAEGLAHENERGELEGMNELEQRFSGGDTTAARDALALCALRNEVMPKWLAIELVKALELSDAGKADDVFGFGNGAMLARWRKKRLGRRDQLLGRVGARTAKVLDAKTMQPVKRKDAIATLADLFVVGPKTIEQKMYPPRKQSPIRTPKK